MSVNKLLYDHEDTTVTLPSGIAFGVTDINYKDGQKTEGRYGRGAKVRGRGRGNYEASADMTMDLDQAVLFEAALAASARGGKFFDHKPFCINVIYASEDLPPVRDQLPEVKVLDRSTGVKQGETNVGVRKYTLIVLKPIKWNNIEAK